MDLGVILLLIALLAGVGLYLAAPLISNSVRPGAQETQEVSSLMAERDRVITALQELDFDFKLGKIPEEDYPLQRAELLQKGAGVLKKLESLSPSPSPIQKGSRKEAQDPESQLERLASEPSSDELTDDKIEAMLAARRKARKTKSGGFCPRCGKPILITDQFCPNCGKALS